MAETKLGGEISLVGFDSVEPMELIVIKKIVGNYVRKISAEAPYNSLKLDLKKHRKGKSFTHEINAQLLVDGMVFQSSVTEWNLYICLNEVFDKVMAQLQHKKRLPKEIGEAKKIKTEKEAQNASEGKNAEA